MVMWTVTYADGTMNQTLEHLIFILIGRSPKVKLKGRLRKKEKNNLHLPS